MTVPTQRGGDPSLSSVILDTIRQVQTSVDRLGDRFDGLDQRFMPRDQIVDRFEVTTRDHAELRAQLSVAKTQHDTDIQHLAEQQARQEQQRTNDRRWWVGTLLTVAALVVAVLAILLTHS